MRPPQNTIARKVYKNFPFAHRQHLHTGHCSLIHGHNWAFGFEFRCTELAATGFVIDFGELGFIKEFLTECFDHTLVLNQSDPNKDYLLDMLTKQPQPLARILVVENCSCEGLAAFVMDKLDPLVRKRTNDRVWIKQVVVQEDSKNSVALFA
jgi:6-pyruvoyltetrahydropterin/6-carboxytetrahydropterin synthase